MKAAASSELAAAFSPGALARRILHRERNDVLLPAIPVNNGVFRALHIQDGVELREAGGFGGELFLVPMRNSYSPEQFHL